MVYIQFQNVNKIYTLSEVNTIGIQNFSISIEKSEFVSIVGPSGCGKTTFLNLLGGIDIPNSGTIISNGHELSHKKTALNKYRRENISFIFQFYNLIPTLTALENVILGVSLNPNKIKNKIENAKEWLNKVGLEAQYHKFPHQLSGGQQQKVSIARALAKQPIILLADEPTGACDSQSVKEIMKILNQLNVEEELTIILVTHNPAVANCANRIIYLKDGQIFGEKLIETQEKQWIET